MRRADVVLGETGDLGDPFRRIVGEEFGHRLPALGVRGDEIGIYIPVLDQQMQQAIE